VDSLRGLTEIKGAFHVGLAANLTSLSGLENVTSMDALQIYESGLTDLTGLGNLSALRSLRIGFFGSVSPSLVSLQGMPQVASLSDAIINAPALTSMSGLENVKHIGILDLSGNAALTSLQGLEGLDSISFGLYIRGNPKLTSLDGLQNLRIIGSDLHIAANAVLTTLDSLKSLVSLGELQNGEGLYLFNNSLLSGCSIESVCKYIQQMPDLTVISGNASGCSSVAEVDSLCANNSSAILGIWERQSLNLFPNPNPGTFSVELPEAAEADMKFRIVGLTGQVWLEQMTQTGLTTQTVQANTLPSGLYFLQWVANGKVLAVEKFVKQ
jgi:hypothetical protein